MATAPSGVYPFFYFINLINYHNEEFIIVCVGSGGAGGRLEQQDVYGWLVKDVTAPSGINDAVAPAQGTTTRKVLNNGKLYIMKDGKVFNAQGAQLR